MRPSFSIVPAVAVSLIAACSAPCAAMLQTEQEAPAKQLPAAWSVPGLSAGPMIGHTEPGLVTIWCRADKPGDLTLVYQTEPDGAAPFHAGSVTTTASEDTDLCVTFRLEDLLPGRTYHVQIHRQPPAETAEFDASLPKYKVLCPPRPREEKKVSIVFGSCAGDPFDKPLPVWDAVAAASPDALCLIGDTPYIDSTDLAHQRKRYREFFSSPQLAAVLARTPTYGVWDDHDFGKNDTDGTLRGREFARQAFLEYHANAARGDEATGQGIYSSFRRGAVEVFLIDARWFSNTAPSFADPEKPTLLGDVQWRWLREGLRRSDAPFKLLVTGMIWNDSVRPLKKDYWGNYAHERKALFEFLAQERITGVVLVGGDIHRSRLLKWPSDRTGVPYPLYELISSPLGSSVHQNANQPNDMLIWDAGSPRTFMIVEAEYGETPTLTVRWRNDKGKTLHEMKTAEWELCPPTR